MISRSSSLSLRSSYCRYLWLIFVLLAALWAPCEGLAADWPTYQHDIARSGTTTEALPPVLTECWEFRSRHAPAPAWEPPRSVPVEGILELPRVRFDDAYHVAVAGDALYFGSSADNKVYCLDASTGQIRWSYFTGGAVRLAPTVSNGRVYVGSDDGCVYCLGASDGQVIWKRQVGPTGRRLLGRGKMVSMWPIRTGVLVDNGVAYYGAGIFPAEGVYVVAVRADDGKLLWRNDTGGEATESRVSFQGYFLATPEVLYTPMGRTTPAAYSRADGRPLQSPTFGKTIGGFSATIVDGMLCTGTEEVLAYSGLTKAKFAWFQARKVIVSKETVFLATDKEMVALNREAYSKPSVQKFTVRDQKKKLASDLAKAKKDKKTLTDSIESQRQTLEQLDQRSAPLPQEGQDQSHAGLKAQRDSLLKALQADRDKLEAVDKKLALLEKQGPILDKNDQEAASQMASCVLWRLPCECPDSLILAGSTLFAGGQDRVVAVDTGTGQELWSAEVHGRAKGLAVAAGRLFVSTDTGAIHAFGSGDAKPRTVSEPTNPSPYPQDALTPVYEAAAERIMRESGVKRGYCLVLGGETGRLAFELAKRTELRIYAIEPDAQKVAIARKALDEAGLYGDRVCVDEGPLDSLPYSDYFANLVVSDRVLVSGLEGCSAQEMFRVLRPLGGVAFIGRPQAAAEKWSDPPPANALEPTALREWLAQGGVKGSVVERGGVWAKVVRPALPDAGRWTHEYADPGNTACGDDRRLKCPLGLLWFGDPGPLQMVSRHVRQAGPLSVNGILFVQGENAVMAYDAYNGLKLWERPIPKVVRTLVSQDVSNLAADDSSFYVAVEDHCLRLDAATGKVKATYVVPKSADGGTRRWGYIAVDKGLLFGSATLIALPSLPSTGPQTGGQDSHASGVQIRALRGRTCDTLFAYSVSTGKLRWTYSGKAIPHSTISVGDGRVFLADQTVSADQKRKSPSAKTANVRLVVALNASTGKVVWQEALDLTGCTGGSYWGTLATMYRNGILVLFGVYTDGHFWKDFFANQFSSRRIVVVSARDGSPMWSRNIGYRVRPLIIGHTLHAEPWAFDLRTGEPVQRVNPITGLKEPWQFARPGHHCGCPAANPNCMFFRSYHIGYYDLLQDYGTAHFGGQRTGCWINFIAANGLLLVPEASSACMCPFPNMCTVVFEPRQENRAWGKYSLSGAILPVKHLALNLGAPGDRKDDAGTLWLAYPRPTGSLVLPLKAEAVMLPKGEYFRHSPDFLPINGTPNPWLYTFGACGLKQLAIPLLAEGEDPAPYTVRLGFAEIEEVKPGQRVFSVLLQGKPALKDFDVVKEAGEPRKVVLIECTGVEVSDKLTIDLVSKTAEPSPVQMPILQTVEVLREKMTGFKLSAPSFALSAAVPEQEGQVKIGNYMDGDFAGTLMVESPDGFSLTPDKADAKVAAGSRLKLTLRAAATKKMPPGRYPVVLKLTGPDGRVECEARSEIDYLGDRSRDVFKPVEAATIGPGNRIRPSDKVLFVDGGNKQMGDEAYSMALLKFKIDLPAKPVSVKFRIWDAGNPTSNGGDICQVTTPWSEGSVTYEDRPQLGPVLAHIGRVAANQTMEVPLNLSALSLEGLKELSLAIVPVNCDGVNYVSIKGETPPELEIECER